MQNINEQSLTLFSKSKVTSADTDMQSHIRLGSLGNFLIQSAINSADSLGVGLIDIKQQNLFWVLSRLTIEIIRPLKWYDEVEVETWPKDIDRVLYLRDFRIHDANANVVAKATSAWLAVDSDSKRPKLIKGIHPDIFSYLKNKQAIDKSPEKLDRVDNGEVFKIKSTYYDIDLNRHVTATRYIDWMMDTFSPEFHKNNYPKSLSINYMRETMPGETIELIREQFSDNKFCFEGKNSSNNTVAFRGEVGF